MFRLILTFLFILIGAIFFTPNIRKRMVGENLSPKTSKLIGGILFVLAGLIFLSTSCVVIDSEEVGHLKRIYGVDMPGGRIIAVNGQKGPQAQILPPGFHISPFIRVLNKVERLDLVEVPSEKLRVITAKDGQPLPEGQYLADEWPETEIDQYLNAEFFMGADKKDGVPRGQKGPQLTVLKPGTYRLNRYLFEISDLYDAKEVEAGFVGVVKSNVGKVYSGEPIVPKSIIESYIEASQLEIANRRNKLTALLNEMKKKTPNQPKNNPAEAATEETKVPIDDKAAVAIPTFEYREELADPAQIQKELENLRVINEEEARKMALTNLSNPLVPQGYIGVWETVLLPSKYYLNPLAYALTPMDTRVQTWRYEGGYTRRLFNLTIATDGAIEQAVVEEPVETPEGAADSAIIHKVEGWDVWLDSRVLVQVTPENAPFVVAYVGSLKEVEDRIITPMYRSVSRNILGSRDVKVLSVLYERQSMEAQVEVAIKPEGLKTGLIIRDVRFGDPYVPPELLIPGKRMQLAQQMNETFKQEQSAQQSRIEVEKKKAEADQQSILIAAQIKKEADEQLGLGSKARLVAEAQGQQAQVAVLGQEKTFDLAMFRELLSVLKDHPDLVKTPHTMVTGKADSLSGAAAILGNSTFSEAFSSLTKKE